MLSTFHYHFLIVFFFTFDFHFQFHFHSCDTGLLTFSLQCFSLYLLIYLLSPLLFVSGFLSYHCPCTPLYLNIVLYLLSSCFIYYSLFPCSLYNHCALELWPWSRLHCTRHYRNTKQIMCLWPMQPDTREETREDDCWIKRKLSPFTPAYISFNLL